ncbi:universal stress protein [Novosphingobium marinum]|uniref:Nucleotide-binding universal stress UspA family protein n=1 Tax=Novosphingobium marinum TaxID=1514948 RepID=A0A7Z0BS71_9SPHN|nr:universal stress protein [Novosphingobium marinum]NYH94596.1 nucleotide-binding universal stress UspA family protein [Novosphingobium marinum]GGC23550.1 universal stress protein [Novosphingobium marinum]
MTAGPIVVATDLHSRSDRAVDRAVRLGRKTGRPVKVVHVVDPDSASAEHEERTIAQVRDAMPLGEDEVDIILAHGSPPKAICQAADDQGAYVIVVAVARYNDLRDYFLGTAVDHVIRNAKAPVIVVKQRPHEDYRKILVPSDFSKHSKEALIAAARLFPKTTIHVLHAYHVPYEGWQTADYVKDDAKESNQRELDEFLSDPDIVAALGERITGKIAYGPVDKAVADAVEEDEYDLVALSSHGQGGLRDLTLGSTASTLLQTVPADTLMVPARD